MVLSAAFKTEESKTIPNTQYLVEIDWPTGTKLYSKPGINSDTQGYYDARVKSFGRLRRAIALRQLGVEMVNPRIVLYDHDYQLRNMLAYRTDLQNSAARIRKGSGNVDFASWALKFSGRVYQIMDQSSGAELTYAVELRPNDLPLTGPFPTFSLNGADFPDTDQTTAPWGTLLGPIYGRFDSSGITGTGAMQTLLVDTVGFRYIPKAWGWFDIQRVYKDGTRQTTGFSITHPIINGRQYSMVDFTGTQGTSAITIDCTGYETVGDGTGTLITSPTDVLRHLLNNFVFTRNTSGVWGSDSTSIDTSSFDSTETAIAKHAAGVDPFCSLYLDGQVTTAEAIINQWASDFRINVFWKNDGTLALFYDNPYGVLAYVDDPWIRDYYFQKRDDGKLELPTFDYFGQDTVSRIVARFATLQSQDSAMSTVELFDPTITVTASDNLDLVYGPAFR